MNAHTTITADQSSDDWTPHTTPPTAIPPLLEGLTASPELIAKVEALEAQFLEVHRLGHLHDIAQLELIASDPRIKEAEDVWVAAHERQQDAVWDLLSGECNSPAEAIARITTHLRARIFGRYHHTKWRQVSAKEAIEILSEDARNAELDIGDALIFAMAQIERVGSEPGLAGVGSSPHRV